MVLRGLGFIPYPGRCEARKKVKALVIKKFRTTASKIPSPMSSVLFIRKISLMFGFM